jgi:hypothetical protein
MKMKTNYPKTLAVAVGVIAFVAFFATFASLSRAHAQQANGDFLDMLAQTGCESKYSDDKKADLYASRWKGTPMTIVGEIADVDNGTVSVKVLRSTMTWDIRVDMRNKRDAYDLEKGTRIMLTFNVSSHGGCFLSFRGNNGVIGNNAHASGH